MRRESAKRRKERKERREVVAFALDRAGGRCEARELVPEIKCWGPLDPDERVSRKRYPGGHLERDNVQMLCRGHHDWKGLHDAEAVALGLSGHSWDRAAS